jgi:hypothetical protein
MPASVKRFASILATASCHVTVRHNQHMPTRSRQSAVLPVLPRIAPTPTIPSPS